MTTEQNLIVAIKKLESAVAVVNVEPKPDLLPHFSRIDELTAQLPGDTSREHIQYHRN
jgi:hypothetical protein